jgi:hypothetical protein
VEKAKTTLAAAEVSLKIAQKGTQIEQRGSAALQQFDENQTSALLTAMEAGQELQTLVRQKAKIKGAKLINQKLALIEYPAISPVGALQQILTQIQEHTLPTRQGGVWSPSWTSDGKTLATAGFDGSVKLWTQDGTPITRLDAGQGSVRSLSWTGYGQTLGTGGDDGSVKLWKQDGTAITRLDAGQDGVLSLGWTGDGQTLATGGYDGSVKLWKRDGTLITRLDAGRGGVRSLSWTADGQILATGGEDGSVKLWPIEDLDALLVRGCNWLKSYLIQTPEDLQKLKVCQTPDLLPASAPNLVEDSEALARAGKIEEAIQGFKTAQQWNPNLRFDPVARAHQLANDAKKEK